MPQFTKDQLAVFCREAEIVLWVAIATEKLEGSDEKVAGELYKFCTYTAEAIVDQLPENLADQAERAMYTNPDYLLSTLNSAAAIMGGAFPYEAVNGLLHRMYMKMITPQSASVPAAPVCGLN